MSGSGGCSEITRVVTDAGFVGYGETLPHYTWGAVTDEAVARVRGRNAAEFLGDDSLGAGLQMALYDVVGKALGVPAWRLFNLPQVREWVPDRLVEHEDGAGGPRGGGAGRAARGVHRAQVQGAPLARHHTSRWRR